MWHLIPGAHYRESGSGASQNPLIYERMPQHADHFHYDTNLAWHKSRYGAADDFGGGHAHVGMAIYQADHFPVEWRNRLLTWNQHGRRLNRERLKRGAVDILESMKRMYLRIPMNGSVEWK